MKFASEKEQNEVGDQLMISLDLSRCYELMEKLITRKQRIHNWSREKAINHLTHLMETNIQKLQSIEDDDSDSTFAAQTHDSLDERVRLLRLELIELNLKYSAALEQIKTSRSEIKQLKTAILDSATVPRED